MKLMKDQLWDASLAKAPSKALKKNGHMVLQIFQKQDIWVVISRVLFFCIPTSAPLYFRSCWRDNEHFEDTAKENLSWGHIEFGFSGYIYVVHGHFLPPGVGMASRNTATTCANSPAITTGGCTRGGILIGGCPTEPGLGSVGVIKEKQGFKWIEPEASL